MQVLKHREGFGHIFYSAVFLSSPLYFPGVVFNSDTYKTTRKFALTALRDFGLGKHSLEERIQDEALALVQQFRCKGGQAFDPNHDISLTVSNIICSINFGKR